MFVVKFFISFRQKVLKNISIFFPSFFNVIFVIEVYFQIRKEKCASFKMAATFGERGTTFKVSYFPGRWYFRKGATFGRWWYFREEVVLSKGCYFREEVVLSKGCYFWQVVFLGRGTTFEGVLLLGGGATFKEVLLLENFRGIENLQLYFQKAVTPGLLLFSFCCFV